METVRAEVSVSDDSLLAASIRLRFGVDEIPRYWTWQRTFIGDQLDERIEAFLAECHDDRLVFTPGTATAILSDQCPEDPALECPPSLGTGTDACIAYHNLNLAIQNGAPAAVDVADFRRVVDHSFGRPELRDPWRDLCNETVPTFNGMDCSRGTDATGQVIPDMTGRLRGFGSFLVRNCAGRYMVQVELADAVFVAPEVEWGTAPGTGDPGLGLSFDFSEDDPLVTMHLIAYGGACGRHNVVNALLSLPFLNLPNIVRTAAELTMINAAIDLMHEREVFLRQDSTADFWFTFTHDASAVSSHFQPEIEIDQGGIEFEPDLGEFGGRLLAPTLRRRLREAIDDRLPEEAERAIREIEDPPPDDFGVDPPRL